jgi:hypothetical protein
MEEAVDESDAPADRLVLWIEELVGYRSQDSWLKPSTSSSATGTADLLLRRTHHDATACVQ